MPTEAASQMKQVVGSLVPLFKDAGFRKRRNAFNRRTSETVTQVVAFQMGAYDPSETPDVPGLRENLYGSFTVNLGVFSATPPSVTGRGVTGWVHEADCQLRMRLGFLLAGYDVWWRLDRAEAVAGDVARGLIERGLPWLDRFPSDQAIVDGFRELGPDQLGMYPRAPLEIAALQVALGDVRGAVETGRRYLAEEGDSRHRWRAEWELRELGLGAALSEDPG